VLLAYIFYDVFRDQKQADQIDEMQENLQNELDEVQVTEFDEEAELDARIWNNFQKRRGAGDETGRYYIESTAQLAR
jgi:hypothetical protein